MRCGDRPTGPKAFADTLRVVHQRPPDELIRRECNRFGRCCPKMSSSRWSDGQYQTVSERRSRLLPWHAVAMHYPGDGVRTSTTGDASMAKIPTTSMARSPK